MIQHVHWNSVNHCYFPLIIFENEYHVEILQMKLYSLEVYKLDVFQCDDERRLRNGKAI